MKNGFTKVQSIERSIALNFVPILITSVTTAIGFLMMNMSDSPVLRDFGNLSALGVMVACFLSVTLLPALLKLLPIHVKMEMSQDQKHFMDRLGDFCGFATKSLVATFGCCHCRVRESYPT